MPRLAATRSPKADAAGRRAGLAQGAGPVFLLGQTATDQGMPMIPKTAAAALAVALALAAPAVRAQDAAIEAMQDYLMFQDYESGILLPRQIDRTVFEVALFVDTRTAEHYAAGTIPGAINIEWREVLDRIDEIPEDRMTILFCNTGSLSAQAAFALRVAGRTNVVVLQQGLAGWEAEAAYRP